QADIADILNEEGLTTDWDRVWTRGTVHRVLTNEKYIGNNVFNRVSFKLKKKRVANTPDMWIRALGAFPAIVEPEIFDAAQAVVAPPTPPPPSRRRMPEQARQRYPQRGALSGVIIDETSDMPSSSTYPLRFGSLTRAYRLVGYAGNRDYHL